MHTFILNAINSDLNNAIENYEKKSRADAHYWEKYRDLDDINYLKKLSEYFGKSDDPEAAK